MKKVLFFCTLLCAVFCVSCSLDDEDYGLKEESNKTVYFFHDATCSNSNAAKNYINATYPTLKMKIIDVNTSDGEQKLKAAMKEYKLGNSVSTPLICCGQVCFQSWNESIRQQLDECLQHYLP